MAKDYQKQFDEALEVIQVSESEGFKTLMLKLETEIGQVRADIDRANDDMLEQVRKEGVESEKFVQKVIRLKARMEGLQFIISQVSFFRRRRDEAVKNLE